MLIFGNSHVSLFEDGIETGGEPVEVLWVGAMRARQLFDGHPAGPAVLDRLSRERGWTFFFVGNHDIQDVWREAAGGDWAPALARLLEQFDRMLTVLAPKGRLAWAIGPQQTDNLVSDDASRRALLALEAKFRLSAAELCHRHGVAVVDPLAAHRDPIGRVDPVLLQPDGLHLRHEHAPLFLDPMSALCGRKLAPAKAGGRTFRTDVETGSLASLLVGQLGIPARRAPGREELVRHVLDTVRSLAARHGTGSVPDEGTDFVGTGMLDSLDLAELYAGTHRFLGRRLDFDLDLRAFPTCEALVERILRNLPPGPCLEDFVVSLEDPWESGEVGLAEASIAAGGPDLLRRLEQVVALTLSDNHGYGILDHWASLLAGPSQEGVRHALRSATRRFPVEQRRVLARLQGIADAAGEPGADLHEVRSTILRLSGAWREISRTPHKDLLCGVLERWLPADPGNLELLLLSAHLDVAAGATERALETLDQVEAVWPWMAEERLLRARIATDRRKFQESLVLLKEASRRDPQVEGLQEAVAALQKAMNETPPGTAGAIPQKGRDVNAKSPDANAEARRAGELEKILAQAEARFAAGDLDAALEHMRAAEALAPDSLPVINALAWVLVQSGNLSGAQVEYLKATRLKPEDPSTHANLAGILIRRGSPERAEASLRKVLQLDPTQAEAMLALARILRDTDRQAEAATYWKGFLAAAPSDHPARAEAPRPEAVAKGPRIEIPLPRLSIPAYGTTETYLDLRPTHRLGETTSAVSWVEGLSIRDFGTGDTALRGILGHVLARKVGAAAQGAASLDLRRSVVFTARLELRRAHDGRPTSEPCPTLEAFDPRFAAAEGPERAADIHAYRERILRGEAPGESTFVTGALLNECGASVDPDQLWMIDGARRIVATALAGVPVLDAQVLTTETHFATLVPETEREALRKRVGAIQWFASYQSIPLVGLRGDRTTARFDLMDLSLLRGARVMDWGCNIGQASVRAALAGAAEVVGIEGMPDTFEAATEVGRLTGLGNLRFARVDFNAPDFEQRIDQAVEGQVDWSFFFSVYRTKELIQRDRLFQKIIDKSRKGIFFEGHADPVIDTIDYYRWLFEAYNLDWKHLGNSEGTLRPLFLLTWNAATQRRQAGPAANAAKVPDAPAKDSPVRPMAVSSPIAAPAPVANGGAPLVTAIVSTYASASLLRHRLENLLSQTLGDRLEVVVIDSCSPENDAQIAMEFARRDPRVRVLRTEARETIYKAWNRGVAMARGTFLTNANTDDALRPDALERLASELSSDPGIDLAYGDFWITHVPNQDFHGAVRIGYSLKPDFAPDIMLSGCHMGPQPMWRRSLHDRFGLFDEAFHAAGDYEFWCRCAAGGAVFRHVPEFLGLYLHNQAGLCNGDVPRVVRETAAVQARYAANLPRAREGFRTEGFYRKEPVPEGTGFVNVGMVTWNRLEFTKQAVEAFWRRTRHPHKLTMVDNGSTDGTRDWLREMHRQGVISNLVLLPENVGIAKASNLAWSAEPDASHYLKLDSDMVVRGGEWLEDMVVAAGKIPDIGALGYSVEPVQYPLETIGGVRVRPKRQANIGGACFLVPKAVHDRVGWWCEDYGLYGEEDGDFALRLRLAGLFNAYMEDDDMFCHLPGGKAGAIDPRDLSAVDPDELRVHEDYRVWKDDLRRRLHAPGGLLPRNVAAYHSGKRGLHVPRGVFLGVLGDDLQAFQDADDLLFLPHSGILSSDHEQRVRHHLAQDGKESWSVVRERDGKAELLRCSAHPPRRREGWAGGRPEVSVVIPVHGNLDLTRDCVESLRATTDPSRTEIVVVDDASPDDTAAWLLAEKGRGILEAVILPSNKGFAGACNAGAGASSGRVLVFLNNDTICRDGWLEPLLSALEDPAVGLAGSRLLYPEGDIQHAGIRMLRDGLPDHEFRNVPGDDPRVLVSRDRPFVTGACIALARELFDEVGGFDEGFHMYVEDLDLCMKVWAAGARVRYVAESVVVHLECRTMKDPERRSALVAEGLRRFHDRWSDCWPDALLAIPDWPSHFRKGPPLRWAARMLRPGTREGFETKVVGFLERYLRNLQVLPLGAEPAQIAEATSAEVDGDVWTRLLQREEKPSILLISGRLGEVWNALGRPTGHACLVLDPLDLSTGDDLACVRASALAWACGGDIVGKLRALPLEEGRILELPHPESASFAEALILAATVTRATLAPQPATPTSLAEASKETPSAEASPVAGRIQWCAPILNFSGYARMNRDLVRSLDRDGIRPSVTPLDSDAVFANSMAGNREELSFWMDVLRRGETREGLFVCSHLPPGFPGQVAENPSYQAHVGLTMFETDRLPAGWAKACEAMDEIWVPSTFNRETFARGGLDPARIQVVPYGIDLSRWDPSSAPLEIEGRRGTNLLAVFEWTRRKGWDLLVEAFARAFGPDDDVSLTLRTRRPANDPTPIRAQIEAHLRSRGLDPLRTAPIVLLEEPIPDSEMPSLYAACDAVVLPTRGEGWGLPFMEALAMERPVVATAWGAHMDFLDDQVGWTIPVDGLEPVDPAQTRSFPLYGADHRWARPSLEALVAILKALPGDRPALRTKGRAGRARLATDWTPERSARWIRERAAFLLGEGGNADPAVSQDAASSMPPVQGLMIRAGFCDFSGYSRLARDTALAIRAQGHPIRIEAYASDVAFLRELEGDPERLALLKGMVDHPRVDGLGIAWFPPTLWEGKDVYTLFREWNPQLRKTVAMTMFETDRISPEWAACCNGMDEVWVPSRFNLETFANSGVDPNRLKVIPLGLRMQDYDPARVAPMKLPGSAGFTFLSVFQWSWRKGWDLLLEAFATEFSEEEDVRLVLRTYPSGRKDPPIRQRIDDFLASRGLSAMASRIQLVEEFVTDAGMPSLLAAGDAFVLPTRGEGWGIPFLEAMALGKPVIATRWSGHMEFMNDANSFLVDIDGLENVQDEMREDNDLYTSDHRWAKPSLAHLRSRMRQVFADPSHARKVGQRARLDVVATRDISRTSEWIRRQSLEASRSSGGLPAAERADVPVASSASAALSTARAPSASRTRPVVAVDARALFDRDSTDRGIGHYAHNHLKALEQAAPDHEFLFLGPDDLDESLVRDHLSTGRVRTLPLSRFRPDMADRLHLVDPMGERPDGVSPFEIAFPGPRTTVFYDLIPLRFYLPHWAPQLRDQYLARLEQAKAFEGTHLCISQSTRSDLVACGVDPSRTGWIGAGLNRAATATAMDAVQVDELLARLGIRGPFFLHVGALDAHKNFQASLSCFLAVRERTPCQLVVVGRKVHSLGAWARNVEAKGLQGVVFTDFLSREDLEALYARAISLLFLSRIEGFGFPLLEAMAQGCPAIAFANSSLPEVGGDAAILVPDNDEVAVVKAMLELVAKPKKRQELSRRGRIRAEGFTWKAVAERTLEAWAGSAAPVGPKPGAKTSPSTAKKTGREVQVPAGKALPHASVPVLWGAPVFDPSGYADEARGFLKGMAGLGIEVSLREAGRTSPTFRAGLPAADRERLDAMLRSSPAAGSTAVVHLPAHGFQRIPGCGHHVGRTMFETDSLPASWVESCNRMDEIWVPTDFNLRTFREAGVRVPLLKVPGGVDSDRFRPGLQPLPLPGRKAGTTYLSVFEWTARKGWDVLLAGWAKAFKPSDDVRLVLRAYPPNAIEGDPVAWIEERIDVFLASIGSSRAACAPIAVLAAQIPDADMPRLYAAADVYLAPSRGEGWGRPHMEAMSCGVPVVATAWSGNLEFQDDGNSWLIRVDRVGPVGDDMAFEIYRGQSWAEPDLDSFVDLLERSWKNRAERAAKSVRARKDVVERWDWRLVAPRAAARLKEIARGIPAGSSELNRPAPDRIAATPPVRWCGPLFNFSGYARLAREAVSGLMDSRLEVTVDPLLNDPEWFDGLREDPTLVGRWRDLLQREPKEGVLVACDLPRSADGRHDVLAEIAVANPGCSAMVAWTMFETDRLPDGWAASLNRMDQVWVPSRTGLEAFRRSGVDPAKLHLVPGGVDPSAYDPDRIRPSSLPGPSRGTTFLSVFQWNRRKGWDTLLEAWSRAFAPTDDVRLVLRCHGAGPGPSVRDRLASWLAGKGLTLASMAPIVLLEDFIPEPRMASLYAACDVFVLPTRGEGWGLPFLEAMASAKPCIATSWGGQTEFLHEGVAWMLPVSGMASPDAQALEENPFLTPEHRWADVAVDSLVAAFRTAQSDPEARRRKGIQARSEVLAKWTRGHMAEAIAKALSALPSTRPRSTSLEHVGGSRLSGILAATARGLRTATSAPATNLPASPPAVPSASGPLASLSIRWEGSQFVHHSLAHVNREICAGLAKAGHDLSLIPFEPDQFGPGADPDLGILANLTNAPLEGPCQVHVRHQWPPNLKGPSEGRWVVIQPWEFGSPPREWIEAFRDTVDDLWAYTTYVRDMYLRAGMAPDRVHVVPLGVDCDRFRPGLVPLATLPPKKGLRFLYVGGTIARKGFDKLLNAWQKAFGPDDPVELLVKDMGGKTTYAGQTGEAFVRQIQESGRFATIHYVNTDLDPADLPSLYASGDVLVHPYRGEGFGLPIAEAMACGLPVVITEGGAADDFCGPAEGWMIPAERVVLPDGKVGDTVTVEPAWWLEPSEEALIQALRDATTNAQDRARKGAAARARILSGFTWDHAVAKAQDRLAVVASRPVRRVLAQPRARRVPDTAAASSGATSGQDLEGLSSILFQVETAVALQDSLQADALSREAVELHPGHPLAWLSRAMVLRGEGKSGKALEALTKSAGLGGGAEVVYETMALHLQEGRNAPALVQWNLLRTKHPQWVAERKALHQSQGLPWLPDRFAKPGKSPKKPAGKKR